ncbi:MAG: aspartate carbamoyltransferase [bacterium]|nr:aspartate carbamoyltransferase [bacterium]
MKKLHHVLSARQFDRKTLDFLCALTTRVREAHRTREGALRLKALLPHKLAMLYFTQPSSRTRVSFEAACKMLGMDTILVDDPKVSSEAKGESKLDSIRTFSSYVDMIIMRSPESGLADNSAQHLDQTPRPIPIINAGSSMDEHPTQALLDIYTFERSFKGIGGIDGKTIVMVGDLKRGRTVRSLAIMLTNYPGVRFIFVAPPAFRIKSDILDFLREKGFPYSETEDFNGAVVVADAVYMTRVQDEHDEEGGDSSKVDVSCFWFRQDHLRIMKPQGIVTHPGPRREELDPITDNDPHSKYWRGMRNGMWMRTAVVLSMLWTQSNPLTIFD